MEILDKAYNVLTGEIPEAEDNCDSGNLLALHISQYDRILQSEKL